jgi:hypothetical protein
VGNIKFRFGSQGDKEEAIEVDGSAREGSGNEQSFEISKCRLGCSDQQREDSREIDSCRNELETCSPSSLAVHHDLRRGDENDKANPRKGR